MHTWYHDTQYCNIYSTGLEYTEISVQCKVLGGINTVSEKNAGYATGHGGFTYDYESADSLQGCNTT